MIAADDPVAVADVRATVRALQTLGTANDAWEALGHKRQRNATWAMVERSMLWWLQRPLRRAA